MHSNIAKSMEATYPTSWFLKTHSFTTQSGSSALHIAVGKGNPEVASCLIEMGADLDAKNLVINAYTWL